VQSVGGAIRYSAEPTDGTPGGGIELIGHGNQTAEGADIAADKKLSQGFQPLPPPGGCGSNYGVCGPITPGLIARRERCREDRDTAVLGMAWAAWAWDPSTGHQRSADPWLIRLAADATLNTARPRKIRCWTSRRRPARRDRADATCQDRACP
jgi:hypothetical protein